MAGGGGALQVPERVKRGKISKRKKKKRLGFHLDLTPLVDITFLLLTFFMFTTTMLKPQIMEMRIPPEIFAEVEVRASELLTILLRDDGKTFYYLGLDEPKPIEINKIKELAYVENLKPNVKNKLITVFKISENAKFDYVIKVLDELNIAEGLITAEIAKEIDPKTNQPLERKRKFTIAPLLEEDLVKIKDL